MTFSPEFRLTAACCRLDGPARDAAVRAVATEVHWDRLLQIVARHRVEGLVYAALAAARVAPPPDVAARLREAATAIAAESLALAAESARLQAALDRAGLVNLVLKGAALDGLAWGRLGLKRAWDIDLLVLPDDAMAARGVLEATGYELGDPTDPGAAAFAIWVGLSKESAFRHRQTGRIVELHWRLADAAGLLPDLSAASPTQTASVAGALTLRTLAEAELIAYLCVHGASHAWSRLKWLADLGALLARRTEAERADLYARAQDLGAGNTAALAFRLCARLLDIPIPAAVGTEIAANRKAARLETLALDALDGGGATEIAARRGFNDRILLSQFLFADGWAFRLAELRRQATSLDDHMRLRLPPSLAFLYIPVRLPLWVWRRLGRRRT